MQEIELHQYFVFNLFYSHKFTDPPEDSNILELLCLHKY